MSEKKKQNRTLKKIAELLATMESINRKRTAMKNAAIEVNRIRAIRAKIKELEQNGIQLDNNKLKDFNLAISEAGGSILPDNIRPIVKYQEEYLRSVLALIPDSYLNNEDKNDILNNIVNEEQFEIRKYEDIFSDSLSMDEKQTLDKIEVDINESEPSRELVKSFLTMSKALEATINHLSKAIDELENYLKSVTVTIKESVSQETQDDIVNNQGTVPTKLKENTDVDEIKKSVEEEQSKIEEEGALFSNENSDLGASITSSFAAPMKV